MASNISNSRSRMVYAARQIVLSLYDLSTSHQTSAAAREKANYLLDKLRFLAGEAVNPVTGQPVLAYFAHESLWEFLVQYLLLGQGKIARKECVRHLFIPKLSPVTIFLASCSLQCAIESVATVGNQYKATCTFEEGEYSRSYLRIQATWKKVCTLAVINRRTLY